jgi:hypothetical protein
MKTLQTQYNLIKEGKGDKAYFMKLARYNFPDLVTPVLSYSDTIIVLKNKSILSEGIGGLVTTGKKQDWHAIFNKNMNSLNELERTQMGMYLMFNKKTGKLENYMESPDHKENNNLKKQIEDKDQYVLHFITGNDYNKFKNSLDKYKGKTRQELDLLTEAKEAKAEEKETTKDVTDMATRGYDYKDTKNYDNVFGQEFLKGFYTEMQESKNKGKDVDELKAIVAKNLAKDMNHYVKDGQFGLKGVGYTTEAPGLGTPKEAKGKHKSSGYGDLKENEDKDFNSWKIKLYNIIMADAGLDKEDIAVDEFEIKKYWKEGKTPDEVYNNIWIKDAGNFRAIGESLKESVLRSQIYLLVKEVLTEGIHDKDITSARHTNVTGKMGDYDPKSRAANLASLANFGPKSKPKNTDEALGLGDEMAFSQAVDFAEDLYDKVGNVEDVLANLPQQFIQYKDELEQHLTQKFEG